MIKNILIISLVLFGSLSAAGQKKDAKFYYDQAMKQSDLNKVAADLTKAIQLNPAYTEAIFYRGVAYFHNHKTQQALTDFNKVLELDARSVAALIYRGKTYEVLDRKTDALKDYNQAVLLSPSAGEVYYLRGLLKGRLAKDPANGCPDLQKAKKLGYKVPDEDMSACLPRRDESKRGGAPGK